MSQPGDVLVINTISIKNNAPAPIVRTNEALGTHKNAANAAARLAFPAYVRQEGMTCWQVDTAELYRLIGGIANTDWVLESGSGATVVTLLMGPGVVVNDFVAKSAVADQAVRSDAAALATGRAIGLVTAINTPAAGQCQVLLLGVAGGFVGLAVGGVYVLASGLPGQVVQDTDTGNPNYPSVTPGSGAILQPVGVATTATTMLVRPTLYFTQF